MRPSETRLSVLWSHSDPTIRGARELPADRPLPAAFLAQEVQVRAGAEPTPLEIRAVPGVRFTAQLLNRRGEKEGFDTWADLSGTLAGRSWRGHVRADADGSITLVAPRGLEKSRFQVMADQSRKLLYRTGRAAPLRPRLDLPGVLDLDLGGIEVVSTVSAIVRIRATDREGRSIAGFSASVAEAPAREGLGRFEETTAIDSIAMGAADGRSWTYWINPSKEVEIKVTAARFKPASGKRTLPEGRTEEVTFVLEPK